jgi:hypothetical protein
MPKMNKSNRNITRVDTSGLAGYVVRMVRKGKRWQKYFGDRKYGGKAKSLAAAKTYRDDLLKKNKSYSRKQLAQMTDHRNKSGIAGVRRAAETEPGGNHVYHSWVAQWSPKPGVRKTKRFSIEKYGEEQAYKMAVKARNKGVREMEN